MVFHYTDAVPVCVKSTPLTQIHTHFHSPRELCLTALHYSTHTLYVSDSLFRELALLNPPFFFYSFSYSVFLKLNTLFSSTKDPDDDDIEAQIDKELEEDEPREDRKKEAYKHKETDDEEEDERWPTPMEPLEGALDPDRDDLITSPRLQSDEDLDEEKKYILDKIQEANKQLQDQDPPDQSRRRRLQFKDTLVDLVVPALEFDTQESNNSASYGDLEEYREVSGQMQRLKISQKEVSDIGDHENEHNEGSKEGRVLVEKDGKFDLVSLKEVESQGLLPPLPVSHNDNHRASSRQSEPGLHLSKSPVSSPRQNSTSSGTESLYIPKPPPKHRNRPSSARPSQRGASAQGTKRRVQSANGAPSHATFTLSPQQKELLAKLQQRRERQAKEV